MTVTSYLLLGSNLGDRLSNIKRANEQLERSSGIDLIAQSGVYISEASDVTEPQPGFLNQALKLNCDLSEHQLLELCEKTEESMGRTAKGQKAPRTIDIDILLYGDQILNSQQLTIPHPRMTERTFALTPLVEIEPELTHPETGVKFTEYLLKTDQTKVHPYLPEKGHHVAP